MVDFSHNSLSFVPKEFHRLSSRGVDVVLDGNPCLQLLTENSLKTFACLGPKGQGTKNFWSFLQIFSVVAKTRSTKPR